LTRPFAKTAQRLRNSSATPPALLRSNATRVLACLAALLLPIAATSTVARAEAEDSAAVEKVTKLNKKAVDEYQNLNFEESRKLLRSAIDVCKQSGLDNHPVTARTYVHLGIVTFLGFKQRDEAIKHFKKALEIQGDIKLDKILATPEVQEVFDAAVSQQADEAAAAKKPPPTETKPGGGIGHEPVTQSPQNTPITIKASVDSSVGAKKVVLSFSADGADDFADKEMKEDPEGSGNYSAEIPASATQGGRVDYFIEALGDEDKVLATKGSQNESLNIAMLGANGQPVAPGIRKPKKPVEKTAGDENPSWFFGLGVGSGLGWTTGNGEIFASDKVNPPGFEMAKLMHFSPEVGYYISNDLLLSVQLRLQLITGATEYHATDLGCGGGHVCSPGTYAFAGLARASYFFGEGDFRTYVAGNLGAGTIRHVATFNSQAVCGPKGNQTCVDTVPSGPIFVGAGAGVAYNVSPAFLLIGGTNALVGFTKFTFNVDLNLGVAFEY
jgi:tetratricopeptide (TPR) repeat protein